MLDCEKLIIVLFNISSKRHYIFIVITSIAKHARYTAESSMN